MREYFKFKFENKDYTYEYYFFEWIEKLFSYVVALDNAIKNIQNKNIKNFLKDVQSTVARFLYYITKEEMAKSDENETLTPLCLAMFQKKYIGELEGSFLKRYITTSLNSNDIFISFLYDFFIDFWSDFENAITVSCVPFEEEIREILKKSNWKNIEKEIKKSLVIFENSEEILLEISKNKERILKKQFIPFSDRINQIFKIIKLDYEKKYNRNVDEDKKILDFGSKVRNTIHNNGKNIGRTIELEIKGKKIKLEQNKEVYYCNYKDIFYIIDEIIDICVMIIETLELLEKKTK